MPKKMAVSSFFKKPSHLSNSSLQQHLSQQQPQGHSHLSSPNSSMSSSTSYHPTQHHRTSSFSEKRRKDLIKLDDTRVRTNPNWDWVNYKGAWTTNIVIIIALRILFGVLPVVTPELAWTLTNVFHNLASFIMFHWIIGTPFEFQGGACDGLTLWEQIDNGVQFTPSKKFFTALPIALFLLSTHYTHYDFVTFCINLIALLIVLIAKLPSMHQVRLFGINKIVD